LRCLDAGSKMRVCSDSAHCVTLRDVEPPARDVVLGEADMPRVHCGSGVSHGPSHEKSHNTSP
jgi:hypothetical protein